jgi:murein DD-endopeptidase MepM/ murein hydrolase activator NlpD
LLNASVGVQRVLARLRPVQSRRSSAAESIHRQNPLLVATMRRVASGAARLPAAIVAGLRPQGGARRRDMSSIPVHVPATNRRPGLAARSLTAGSSERTTRSTAPVEHGGHAHQPVLPARSAPAGKVQLAGPSRLARRSLIASIGAERAVPAAAIAIVLLATALSSAPSLGASGAVGGPTGNGPDARLGVGGVAGAGGALGAPAGGPPGSDAGAATGVTGGVDGTIDQSGPDGGVAAVGGSTATDPQANLDPSFVDDGTLLKPVAVDTTVSDGSALMRSYRVRSGDTLTGIAHKFGVTMMTIWWANNLTAKDKLHIGQTLTIPPVDGVVVTVGSSDTLDSLAAKYGVDAATIINANGLQDPNLVIGQTLTVPGALGDGIATPKPTHAPPVRSGGSGGSSGGSHSVSPPVRYSGGKLSWPVAGGYISQYFHYGHYAIDIAADPGTAVKAAAAGVVTFAGWKNNGGGYQVWVSHGSGLYTTYNHMSAVGVGRGQHVGRGDFVGRVGMTGNATGPHLHFEVWRGPVWDGGTRVNPLLYL